MQLSSHTINLLLHFLGSGNMGKYSALWFCIVPPFGRANTATIELNIFPYCPPSHAIIYMYITFPLSTLGITKSQMPWSLFFQAYSTVVTNKMRKVTIQGLRPFSHSSSSIMSQSCGTTTFNTIHLYKYVQIIL